MTTLSLVKINKRIKRKKMYKNTFDNKKKKVSLYYMCVMWHAWNFISTRTAIEWLVNWYLHTMWLKRLCRAVPSMLCAFGGGCFAMLCSHHWAALVNEMCRYIYCRSVFVTCLSLIGWLGWSSRSSTVCIEKCDSLIGVQGHLWLWYVCKLIICNVTHVAR